MNISSFVKAVFLDYEYTKPPTLAQTRQKVLVTSFTILFFELLCIRWLPAYVRFLAYFSNFIMLASFLGIGLGILSSRRKTFILPSFSVWLLVIVLVTYAARFELYLPSTQVLYYAAGEQVAPPENALVLPIIFFLVTIAFVILSRPLGFLLRELPPLEAYFYDILGSLAGIASFFAISYFSAPPSVWFIILSLSLILMLPSTLWKYQIPFLVGAVYSAFLMAQGSLWSPYYRIHTILDNHDGIGYIITVNNVGIQKATHYLNKENFTFLAYDLFGSGAFRKVLILGAGSGSDVSVAIHNGAEDVDAVEIDPMVYQLGVELHPDKPYQDNHVHAFVNDGRSFLQNTTKKYDLIIFALPDSLTLTSSYSSLRLESFLMTTDALKKARSLLNENGLVVLYNYYRQDWLIQKLAGMMELAFNAPPFVRTYGVSGRAAVIMDGPRLKELDPSLLVPYSENHPSNLIERGLQLPIIGQGIMYGNPNQTPAVDNWPFVYMPNPTIPVLYMKALAGILLIGLVLGFLITPKEITSNFNWHFFFLGVAFMLLETRSLVSFGLLFGNTWMINSLVFFAILGSVLLAILINAKADLRNVFILYVFLIGVLLLNYLLPLESMLTISNSAMRYGLASVLTFSPIFFANIVFSHSFRESLAADIAFASNLIGAMLGGVMEYSALQFGYQALLLIVALFYLLAYLTRSGRYSNIH